MQHTHECGRVLRGTQPDDFLMLTNDFRRRVVLLMGTDGLSALAGRPGREQLHLLGYTDEHIEHLVYGQHMQFELVTFQYTDDMPVATWSAVVALASKAYPELGDALTRQLESLQLVSFADIEGRAGYSFATVKDSADPRYMTLERYMASDQGLVATRAFLYYTLQLRELFSGDGYTYAPDGSKGIKEYAGINCPVAALSGARRMPITVS